MQNGTNTNENKHCRIFSFLFLSLEIDSSVIGWLKQNKNQKLFAPFHICNVVCIVRIDCQ